MSWNKKRSSSKATRDLSNKASLNVPLCAPGLRGKISVEQPLDVCCITEVERPTQILVAQLALLKHCIHCSAFLSSVKLCPGPVPSSQHTIPGSSVPVPQGALQPCCAAAPLLHCSTQLQHWQCRGCSEHRPVQTQPCLCAALVPDTNLAEPSFPMKCNRVTPDVSDQEL